MRKRRNEIFNKKPEVLKEMFDLRVSGWSLGKLADKYKVDRKTIFFRCQESGIVPKMKVVRKYTDKATRNEIKLGKLGYKDEFGETINVGHDYQWYLKKAGLIHRRPKWTLE